MWYDKAMTILRRKYVVIGVSDWGYVAPVSRHWTRRAAEHMVRTAEEWSPIFSRTGDRQTFHVVCR